MYNVILFTVQIVSDHYDNYKRQLQKENSYNYVKMCIVYTSDFAHSRIHKL